METNTKIKTKTTRAPWCALQSELLELIAKRLDTRMDLLHFRGVCTAWRSSVPPPPLHSSPHFFSHKIPFPNGKRRGHYTLAETTIYCIEPLRKISNPCNTTKTWLVKVQEFKPGKVRLKDPLSRFWLEYLPENFPILNLLDFRVSEIGKSYGVQFVNLSNKIETQKMELESITIKKVAVSSNSFDFAVMAVHSGGKLGMWKWGDKKWTNIDEGREGSYYEDIDYHKGKFYALDSTGLAITVDSSLKITKVAAPFSDYGDNLLCRHKYLVKSCGDLYLVYYYVDLADRIVYGGDSGIDSPVNLNIYRLNEEEKDWVPVYSLGDRVFFLGTDGSYSVSARDFSGCKANCVYYSESCFSPSHGQAWIFDLEGAKFGPLSAFPGYSKIFWPPPTWFKGNPRSSSRH